MDKNYSTKYNRSMVHNACIRSISEITNILSNFFEKEYDVLQTHTKNLFIKLLEHSDENLFQWLIGEDIPTENTMHDLILYIRYLYNKK